MSHPAHGAPPRDERAGHPADAARLISARARVGARALEVAVGRDPSMKERLGETGLARLLRDTEIYVERLSRAIAAADPYFTRDWADWVAPVYRRRKVPMDDLIGLSEGLRQAAAGQLSADARPASDEAIDAAIAVFRSYRRIAGDARRRNRLLAAIYKGA